jgi:glycosyltransferase involved in cell wall biosynthesis
MSPGVSIVIPLYNKETFIKRVLRCIEGQTFQDWECIIVDDGSTDSSPEIAKEFINNRGDRWRYIRQDNRGQASARNLGIDASSGRYIAFLDADDFWPANKTHSQFLAMEADPECVLVLSQFVIFNQKSKLPRLISHSDTNKLLTGWLSMLGFGGGIESVGLVRRSALGSDLRFDESLSTSSGLDFSIRVAERGSICFLKEIGLLYRISEGQWHSDTKELLRNLVVIREKYQGSTEDSLLKYHSAYIFWAGIKPLGWKTFAFELSKSLLHPDNVRNKMAYRLIRRNFEAKILGMLKYRYIKTLLAEENHS